MTTVSQALTYSVTSSEAASVSPAELCTLSMQGAYPTLTIADVQGQGSANLLSKVNLWTMLSIDK